MKNKLFWNLFKYCKKIFKKSNIYYGHNTYNYLSETIHLMYSLLNININKKYNKIKNININKNIKKKIIKLVKLRIKKKIPIAYLTKNTWFCKKKIYINRNVTIPKSPISEIINKKLIKLKKNPKYILDLCTGSGCIAIACSYLYPKSYIDASDISYKALKIAKKNIFIHKKHKQIKIIKSNIYKNIKNKKYDLIISNPPYLSKKDIKKLPKEYSYEPKISLIAKKNGLYIIQKIINKSYNFLNKKGYLICETGHQKKKIIKNNKKIKFNWFNLKNKKNNIFYIKKEKLNFK